jgi:multidrug efflux pump subunit AcrB
MKKEKTSKSTIWQKFGLFFYDKKPATVFLWITAVFLGVMSYTSWMRRDGFPSVNIPYGIVQVISLENTAKQVDEQFVSPIVTELKKDTSVKDVASIANDQGASIQVSFKDGTDVQSSLDRVRNNITSSLPASGKVVYVKVNAGKMTNEGDDILLSVHGEQSSTEQLDTFARDVAPKIKNQVSLAQDVRAIPMIESVNDTVTGRQTEAAVRFDKFYDHTTSSVHNSTLIAVKGVEGVDQLKLYDQVITAIQNITSSDGTIHVSVAADFAQGIREQISGLQRNLIEGLIVVIIVSFLMISLRGSLITAVAMSSTVLITVGVLNLIGYSLNTITLFSLVLCLALIVDDTTIMVEAIDAGLQKGIVLRAVVADSLKKVARASTTGTLTTILAFSPMLFIGGVLGEFVRAIPVTIIISLLTSLFVSFIFIPLMMGLAYKSRTKAHSKAKQVVHKKSPMARIESGLGLSLARMLLWSVRRKSRSYSMRIGAVLLSFVFLIGGVMIFAHVEFNIFPSPKDGNDIAITGQVVDRETASVEKTSAYADKVLAKVVLLLGDNVERISLGFGANGTNADRDGFYASVLLKDYSKRETTSVEMAQKLQTALNEEVPELNIQAAAAGVGPPASSFTVRITTDNTQQAYLLAKDIKAHLETTVLKRKNNTTAGFKDVTVTPSIIIYRQDGQRTFDVTASFTAKDTSALVEIAKDNIRTEFSDSRVASYGLDSKALSFSLGQEEDNQDSFSSMGKAMGPLLLAILILMGILFKSFVQPFLIVSALPFAFFGIACGLYLTDNPISFFSMLGVFALIGISLNNSILLTDYANQACVQGEAPAEAMADAITKRIRPLLTTSITSILALLPLALNDPFWEGLAYALVFGLISSTLLVILVFPYFYLIAESVRELLRKAVRGVKKIWKHAV